ncbi:DUF3570 domain-containing protein [Costertonia aggregata]|uniref:DUF3570 domain-containing protein n=1 Tax=Costertonia aggregata TaxID=343403 RepID=A0A7H9AV30_9FLAO|nr:DUF3570 domain-containing protein [Costertonia aggregata]QLG47286.1 DUF3570 domain-containing protein [Costertonia aggregata]
MKSLILLFLFSCITFAQNDSSYKKRVLESAEVDVLFSYYGQNGQNAAVTGGEGTEELTDATSTIVVRLPMGEDGILTVDAGISAYTSASSSNVNPLDGNPDNPVSPFSASSGASRQDVLSYVNPTYEHFSENRNSIYTANLYISSEYDYFSFGFGAGYSLLFNEKNTEISIKGQVYLDKWNSQYPIELRGSFFDDRITGIGTYDPNFTAFENETRNSYALSLGISQILGEKIQGSVFMDVVSQNGLLSTPFQRVYFGDVNDFFINEFQLADDVERLPDSRLKIPLGGRLNFYLNDTFVLRTYYRFYADDWGITSHTANLEVPIKLNDKFTIYPNYRYYTQTAADYFYEKEDALSSFDFYTSDYDLSEFNAHQYGLGFKYRDIFTKAKVFFLGLKTIDLRFNTYNRNDGLDAYIVTLGTTFVSF